MSNHEKPLLFLKCSNLDYYRINWLMLIVWANHTKVIIIVGWGIHKKKGSIPDFYDFQLVWWLTLFSSFRGNVGCQIMENLNYSLSIVTLIIMK